MSVSSFTDAADDLTQLGKKRLEMKKREKKCYILVAYFVLWETKKRRKVNSLTQRGCETRVALSSLLAEKGAYVDRL